MTARRPHDLTLEALEALPEPCRTCVFWEAGRPPRTDDGEAVAAEERKRAWWEAMQLDWGTPGKAVFDGERLVGYVGFGPPERLAGARRMGGMVSDDALLLTTLWVDPDYRGAGLGKLLLQSALRETYQRGERALEAYGARGDSTPPCVVSERFLAANGFSVVEENWAYPRLRLDLRQTSRWQESVSSALETVVAALGRRERRPAPVGSVAVPTRRR